MAIIQKANPKPNLWVFQCNVLQQPHWENDVQGTRHRYDWHYFWLNQLMTQKSSRIKSWLNNSNQALILSTFLLDFHSILLIFSGFLFNFIDFWAITKFHWPFWTFNQCHDSNQLMTQSPFQELTQNQLMDPSGFLRHWFRLTHDSKCFAHFSIQINSWLKQKAFDSESTHDLTLSHTHVCKGSTIQERPFTLLEIDCPRNTVPENISAAYQGVVHRLMGREVEKLCPGPDSNRGPPTSQSMMLPLSHQELAPCWLKFGLPYKGMEAMTMHRMQFGGCRPQQVPVTKSSIVTSESCVLLQMKPPSPSEPLSGGVGYEHTQASGI